jgi:hypothetical protein
MSMVSHQEPGVDRRAFVSAVGAGGIALWLPIVFAAEKQGGGGRQQKKENKEEGEQRRRRTKKKENKEEEVSPPEDLMREHGVLKRVLLVYEEAIRRIDARQDLQPDTVRNSASIIRTFIEDYHEKLEEDYLFPRFEKARRLTDLTTVLPGAAPGGPPADRSDH